MRETFLKLWEEASEMEEKRVNGIYFLYEEIVKSNSSIFGANFLKDLSNLKESANCHDNYKFLGIVREKELDAFVNLCFNLKEKPDL